MRDTESSRKNPEQLMLDEQAGANRGMEAEATAIQRLKERHATIWRFVIEMVPGRGGRIATMRRNHFEFINLLCTLNADIGDVPFPLEDVASLIGCDVRTARRMKSFYCELGTLIERPQEDRFGKALAPTARLRWDSVLGRPARQGEDSVPAPEKSEPMGAGQAQVTAARPPFSCPEITTRSGADTRNLGADTRNGWGGHKESEKPLVSDEGPCVRPQRVVSDLGRTQGPLLERAWRCPQRVLACAQEIERKIEEDIFFCLSEDDNGRTQSATLAQVQQLADKAGKIVWGAEAVPPKALGMLLSAAVVAKLLFSDSWLTEAAHITAQSAKEPGRGGPVRSKHAYLRKCIRQNCSWMFGGGVRFTTEDGEPTWTWFEALLRPAYRLIADRLPAKAEMPAGPVLKRPPRAQTPAEQQRSKEAVLAVIAEAAANGDDIAQGRLRRLGQGAAGAEGAAAGAAAENTLKRELQPKARGP